MDFSPCFDRKHANVLFHFSSTLPPQVTIQSTRAQPLAQTNHELYTAQKTVPRSETPRYTARDWLIVFGRGTISVG